MRLLRWHASLLLLPRYRVLSSGIAVILDSPHTLCYKGQTFNY